MIFTLFHYWQVEELSHSIDVSELNLVDEQYVFGIRSWSWMQLDTSESDTSSDSGNSRTHRGSTMNTDD